MSDFLDLITALQDGFQRLDHQVPYARAAFALDGREFLRFAISRPGRDGNLFEQVSEPGFDPSSALYWELHDLTRQASLLVREILLSGQMEWYVLVLVEGEGLKQLDYDFDSSLFVAHWLVFLMHTYPVCLSCREKGLDGKDWPASAQAGGSQRIIWIDGYHRVCVSALAAMKQQMLWTKLKLQSHAASDGKETVDSLPDSVREKPGVELASLDLHADLRNHGASQFTGPHPPASILPTRHSDDFRSVHWFGTDYFFTEAQADCIRVLWKAWANGTPDLSQDYILAEAEVESPRLSYLFSDHPAWKTMIVSGHTKGTFQLNGPSPSQAPIPRPF